ncbi:regucalcin isoform X1 [Bemisia tabaci]|uniref:regucalcin isoform X1 n=1 Tax=Bemisia tabaci TaxID=7038 RepID=UPI003B288ADF
MYLEMGSIYLSGSSVVSHFLSIFISLLSTMTLSDAYGLSKGPLLQQVTQPVIHGEGPHWDARKQVLYFIDTTGKSAHKYDPHTGQTAYTSLGDAVGVMVPVEGSLDEFVAGVGRDLVLVQWDGNSTQSRSTVLDSVEPDKPGNRFNDGKADAKGRLWIGTIGYEDASGVRPNEGNLYDYSSETCKLRTSVTGITTSNGIAWSRDNRHMYYIDTGTSRIDVFDYDIATGHISNRRPVFDLKANNVPGYPDGMTIDTEGYLWVACYLGSRVIKVDPRDGRLKLSIHLPVEKVTSVMFGGANLDILYVTTSRRDLSPAQLTLQPMAGSVLAVTRLGSKGWPANRAVLCNKYYEQGSNPSLTNSQTY